MLITSSFLQLYLNQYNFLGTANIICHLKEIFVLHVKNLFFSKTSILFMMVCTVCNLAKTFVCFVILFLLFVFIVTLNLFDFSV